MLCALTLLCRHSLAWEMLRRVFYGTGLGWNPLVAALWLVLDRCWQEMLVYSRLIE